MACLLRMLTLALRSVSSRTAKIASRTSSVTAGCPPPLLGARRAPAPLAQPAVVGAAAQPDPPPPALPPDQRVEAHGIQAQHPGLLPVHGLQLRPLRPPARGQRRGVRVVLRPRLTR